jgi:hypothetical protein
VMAFGLLFSPASAQEQWSKEETEAGIKRLEYTRHVPSGKQRTLNFHIFTNPDCSIVEGMEIKKTQEPKHGTIEIVLGDGFSQYTKDNVRSKCNGRKLRGSVVNYKSSDGYKTRRVRNSSFAS